MADGLGGCALANKLDHDFVAVAGVAAPLQRAERAVLEAHLHDGEPRAARVVFCGRRPLYEDLLDLPAHQPAHRVDVVNQGVDQRVFDRLWPVQD